MGQQFKHPLLLLGLALTAFALLTFPTWQWLWTEWMGNSYYSHGVLIAPVSLYLVVQRFRHDPTLSSKTFSGSNYGFIVVGVSLVAYLFFVSEKAHYLASLAVIGLIAGLVWTLAGTVVVKKLAFPIGFLIFMVPMPFVERLTYPLARFTGVCSTGVSSFLGLQLTVVGNAVTLPNSELVIGAQCSGINSLIALTALAALMAYLFDGPMWARVALVIAAIPLALFGNILRVASLLFVASWYGADAAFTFYHDYSGPVFFIFSLALLWPTSYLLHCRSLRKDVI